MPLRSTTFATRSITKVHDTDEFNCEHEKRTTTHKSDEVKEMKSDKSKVSHISKSQARKETDHPSRCLIHLCSILKEKKKRE